MIALKQQRPETQLETLCRERDVGIVTVFVDKKDATPFTGKGEKWEHFEWEVTLLYQKRSHKTVYRCGMAHVKDTKLMQKIKWGENYARPWSSLAKPPTAADVLSSLCADARSADRTTFEDWCSDLGYDEDSRTARRTYEACVEINAKLHALLGQDFDLFADAEH